MEFYGGIDGNGINAGVAWCAPPPGLRSINDRKEKELKTLIGLGLEPHQLSNIKVSKHIDDIVQTFDDFETHAIMNREHIEAMRTSGVDDSILSAQVDDNAEKLYDEHNKEKERQKKLRQSFIDNLSSETVNDVAEHSIDASIVSLANELTDNDIVYLRTIFGSKINVTEDKKVYYGESKIRLSFDGEFVRAYPTMMGLSLGNRGDLIGLLKRHPKTQIAVTHRVLENKVEQFVDMIGKSTVQFDTDYCGFNVKIQVPGEDPRFVCLIDAINYDKIGIAALFLTLLLLFGITGYMTLNKTRLKLHNQDDCVMLVEKGITNRENRPAGKTIYYAGV